MGLHSVSKSLVRLPSDVVILPRKMYDRLTRKLEDAEKQIKRLQEEENVLMLVAEGDRAFEEGKTIVARSSRDALKQRYAKQ